MSYPVSLPTYLPTERDMVLVDLEANPKGQNRRNRQCTLFCITERKQ
jgi:hypothetical protein